MTTEMFQSILTRYPANRKDSLLPLLQEIQREQGYLTEEVLNGVGKYLNLPANKVYGVATFYDQFRFHPQGLYHIRICRGTACHLFGSSTFQAELERQLRVKAGQSSKDRRYSLEISNCLGACDSAPVVSVNDTVYTRVTAEMLTSIINGLKEKTK